MSNDSKPTAIFALPDKLGGVFSFVENLLAYRQPDSLFYQALLLRNRNDVDDPSNGQLLADETDRFTYRLPEQNVRSVLRRAAATFRGGPGVLVANEWLSLAAAGAHRTGKSVINITHGDFDFYYGLATMYEPVIDKFVTYTEKMEMRLRELMPDRSSDIHCIPYGVDIPPGVPRPVTTELRLLYSGRLDRSKGIFDLPQIDAALLSRGLRPLWTMQGPGPDGDELRASWRADDRINWRGATSIEQARAEYLRHDILVMPSRAEGLPVALLEAMAAGCVPVVSDLESGIRQVVENGVTGYRVRTGDTRGFAEAIGSLFADVPTLRTLSENARRRIAASYDVHTRAPQYQQLVHETLSTPPRWSHQVLRYGSRLDKPWIPNLVVETARSVRQKVSRAPESRKKS